MARPGRLITGFLIGMAPWTMSPALSDPGDLALQQVASGIGQPLTVRHAGDGSGRLFVIERAGRIRVIDPVAGLLTTPFLDITASVDAAGGEQGLLGLAFHPDYAANGRFYVYYTRDPGAPLDRSVVARYTVSGNPDVADAGSGVTLLELEQPFANHNGGNILFGPDGYLYVGLGDGGGGGDPNENAQNPGTLLGSILRLDVDATPPAGPNDLCGLVAQYGIPADNPFAGGSGDCDEIWAYGVRNPWRWSFDRLTGDLWIGDVGQGGAGNPPALEEVDLQSSASAGGENYGWDVLEGTQCFEDVPAGSCATFLGGAAVAPVLDYAHASGRCSVTGGYRYRGHHVGALRGTYLYGDYCTGEVWGIEPDGVGGWTTPSLLLDMPTNLLTFGEDEAGELYVAGNDGKVYRLVSPSSLFTDDFESGNASAWSGLLDLP